MAKQANQRLKALIMAKILLEQTDEHHPISVDKLVVELNRWGIPAERKSLYDDRDALRLLPLDVQSRKGKQGGWFIGQRTFELPELKLLVDAVQSCKIISKKKSDELIRKLETLTSSHQARQLQRQVYVDRRVKSNNEQIYYTVDQIHQAISLKKGVSFSYFMYNVKKEKVFRQGGTPYHVIPYGLIWDNAHYYLVGWDNKKRAVRHYRVDRMEQLSTVQFPQRGEGAEIDIARYTCKHFGMFAGEERQVILRCSQTLVGVILDQFGQEVILVPDGETHFTVTVNVVVSPQFFGWLFGLGTEVEILAPAQVATEYRQQVEAVAQRLSSPPDGT